MSRSILLRHCLQKILSNSSRDVICKRNPWKIITMSRTFGACVPRRQCILANEQPARLGDDLHDKSMETGSDPSPDEIIASLDPEQAKKLKVLQLELEMYQHFGYKVPENITAAGWLDLLDIGTQAGRRKYYKYLWGIEIKKRNKAVKKAAKAEQEVQRLAEREPGVSRFKNTIFMIIRDSTIDRNENYRLLQAMKFGPEIIFDLSFNNSMKKREIINLTDQLLMAYGENRHNQEPFHFIFTGVKPNDLTTQYLEKSCGSTDKLLATITEQSYLDLYPRDRLVYLSPHARTELKEYNNDDVYIIGGIVDKSNTKPLTMAKAKEQNIRMAKFPLDKYLVWCQGTKSLTVDQAFKILLDLRTHNDWHTALRHVPKRKILQRSSVYSRS